MQSQTHIIQLPTRLRDRETRQAGRHVAAPHNLSRCVIISPSIYIECDNCLDFYTKISSVSV